MLFIYFIVIKKIVNKKKMCPQKYKTAAQHFSALIIIRNVSWAQISTLEWFLNNNNVKLETRVMAAKYNIY